jgi:hypothetical protein
VERYVTEFAKYHRENMAGADELGVRWLKEKQTELAVRVAQAEAKLVAAKNSADEKAIRDIENEVRWSRAHISLIEARVADIATRRTRAQPLPFRIIEARIISGMPWTRDAVDFTAELSRLIDNPTPLGNE